MAAEASDEEEEEEPWTPSTATGAVAPRRHLKRRCALTTVERIEASQGMCGVCLTRMRQWACECPTCQWRMCVDCLGNWKKSLGGDFTCPGCRASGSPSYYNALTGAY